MIVSQHCYLFTSPEIRALLAVASRDDARVNLCCIGLDPSQGSAIATDGHRLLAASVKPLDGAPTWKRIATLPRAVADAAATAAGTRGIVIVIAKLAADGEPDAWTLHAIKDRTMADMVAGEIAGGGSPPVDAPAVAGAAATFQAPATGATFPPWRAVMPKTNPAPADGGTAIGLNGAYLADAAAALASVAGGGAITVWPATTPLEPFGLAVASRDTATLWRAVIMPMRHDRSAFDPVAVPDGAPAWDATAATRSNVDAIPDAKPAADVVPMAGKRRRKAG